MSPPNLQSRRQSAAFTLVELLVVIVIVAVLATLAFMAAQKSLAKAASVKSLSNIRQSGTLLLGEAMDKNGRLRYFRDGEGNFNYRAYIIIQNLLNTPGKTCEIMHWNAPKLKPAVGNEHWTCRGINFTDVPDLGVKWSDPESITDSAGLTGNIYTLPINSVTRPEAFPFLLDSSNASGKEIFRIDNNGDPSQYGYPGLRNSGKAHAFFLDGSARELGPADLRKAGFTKAYDNSNIKSPKLKNL